MRSGVTPKQDIYGGKAQLPDARVVQLNPPVSVLLSHPLLTQSSLAVNIMAAAGEKPEPVSISPLLKSLAYPAASEIQVSAEEIASAFALIFEDRISEIQTAALLTLLHSTGKDRESDVIAKCSQRMREAASPIEKQPLKKAVKTRGRKEGNYRGGLVSNYLYGYTGRTQLLT